MKKRFLLVSAVALVLTANLSAQDATPSQFKFQDLPEGSIESLWGKGANPSDVDLTATGSIIACVAPPQIENLTFEATSSALSIVKSEFGNLLLVKGKNAPVAVAEGSASNGNLSAGWWNLAFVGPKSVTNKTHRATVQMKLVTDLPASETIVIKFAYVTGNNVPLGEREVIYCGDKGWFQAQLEGTVGTDLATRSRIGFPGGLMDQSALYVYEASFEIEPTTELYSSPNDGTPGGESPIGAVANSIDGFTNNSAFVTWDNVAIYVNNAASENVEVYSIGGQLVYNMVATGNFVEIPMTKGVYVVKVGEKSTKVIL